MKMNASITSLDSRPFSLKERGIPPWVLLLILIAVPLCIVGWLNIWSPSDGRLLIIFLSGLLFVGTCCVPIIYITSRKQQGRSIVLVLACIIYLFTFGLRSYYLVAFPDVSLFPNFDSQFDWLYLHRGLLWGSVGMAAMAAGYFIFRGTNEVADSRVLSKLARFLQPSSSFSFILILYGLGLLGRLYQLKTGAALYLYNSPSFDLIADRDESSFGGVASLMADFCPLAFGAMIAIHYQNREKKLLESVVLKVIILIMLVLEVLYFLYSSYKFGLLGTLMIPWIVFSIRSKKWSKLGLVFFLIFVCVVLPIINASRERIPMYYSKDVAPTLEWFDYMNQAAREAYVEDSGSTTRQFLDPLFMRLTGAEALAVSEKYTPDFEYEWGTSYMNFVTLIVPRALRFWSSAPTYIPWETKYVGFLSTNFTVIPMPALVEAYVNFGIIGVCVVMFLLGRLYRWLDAFSLVGHENAFAAGFYAYATWRVLNIEQNLFIVLLPLLKLAVLLLILCGIWRYVRTHLIEHKRRMP
jgi:hypothetical protein